MKRRISTSLVWKGAALVPAGAIAVHQLRYTLAYGPSAGHELLVQGHSYLTSITPWIVLIAAAGLGALLGSFAQTLRGRPAHHGDGVTAVSVWLAASLALLAVYVGQELLEGFLATGHPGGLGGVFGGGGWWAIPVAHAVALALTLFLRGADAALIRLAARRLRVGPRRAVGTRRIALNAFVRVPAPFASSAPGRAPPVNALLNS